MRRRILGIVIVGLWLVTMGVLVVREFGAPGGGLVLDTGRWLEEPTESWLAIFTRPAEGEPGEDDRVGYAHLRQGPEERRGIEGALLELRVRLLLRVLGRRAALELDGVAWRARHRRLGEIDFSVRSGEADFRLRGDIVDDRLEAVVESGGETSDLVVAIPDNALFSTGFGTALAFPELEPGERIVIPSFDPMTLRPSRSRVEAVSTGMVEADGGTVPATRLLVTSGGLTTTAWVDADGQVVRADTPLGLSLRRTTREDAIRPVESSDNASELLRITAVRPSGLRPRRGAGSLDVRIPGVRGLAALRTGDDSAPAGASEPGLALPLDFRQRNLDGASEFRLGITAPPHPPPSEAELEALTGADAFIQSNHPRIRSRAEEILVAAGLPPGPSTAGATDDPQTRRRRAEALHDWVFETLTKEPVLSLPSALEVLESLRGDCNEHTILYTALARAVGLPTRVAIGLVWSDLFDGFYYHAWPEVWLGDGWIALDPTFGQRSADATHIKLLEGSIDRWPQLLPFLGRIDIEVLAVDGSREDASP